MGFSTGIDARGRPYQMINGRRINKAGGKGKSSKDTISHTLAAPKEKVRRLMQRWFGFKSTQYETRRKLKSLLQTKFNLWFKIDSLTKVGNQGRLFAMREILKQLKDDTPPKEFVTPEGKFNYPRFVKHLETKHNITVDPNAGEGETQTDTNDDGEILRIVHNAGLNATRLAAIIAASKSSDSVRSGSKEPRPER